MYDLVIIGSAAAGSAAAIYGARRNLNQVVVAKDTGGEVALCGEVENWPGIEHTTGVEMANNFLKHVKSYNVPMDIGFEVTKIVQEKNYHIVHAKNYSGEEKTYQTKAVIIGTGIHPRHLGVPGEENLQAKGVTYCTVCDGPLYKGKITTTIGAGNSALESALMMSELASKVYLITKYPEATGGGFPKGENILVDKVKQKDNVEIIYEAMTTEILGTDMVTGVKYKAAGSDDEVELETNAAMIHIGMNPNSGFTDCVEKNDQKEITVDLNTATSCAGIFAAGDVTNTPFKQIIISAGMGATAALSAIDYINRWKEEG